MLTAPVVQPCDLLDLPEGGPVRVVSGLMAEFQGWHQFDQAQLTLNLYELLRAVEPEQMVGCQVARQTGSSSIKSNKE